MIPLIANKQGQGDGVGAGWVAGWTQDWLSLLVHGSKQKHNLLEEEAELGEQC